MLSTWTAKCTAVTCALQPAHSSPRGRLHVVELALEGREVGLYVVCRPYLVPFRSPVFAVHVVAACTGSHLVVTAGVGNLVVLALPVRPDGELLFLLAARVVDRLRLHAGPPVAVSRSEEAAYVAVFVAVTAEILHGARKFGFARLRPVLKLSQDQSVLLLEFATEVQEAFVVLLQCKHSVKVHFIFAHEVDFQKIPYGEEMVIDGAGIGLRFLQELLH